RTRFAGSVLRLKRFLELLTESFKRCNRQVAVITGSTAMLIDRYRVHTRVPHRLQNQQLSWSRRANHRDTASAARSLRVKLVGHQVGGLFDRVECWIAGWQPLALLEKLEQPTVILPGDRALRARRQGLISIFQRFQFLRQ